MISRILGQILTVSLMVTTVTVVSATETLKVKLPKTVSPFNHKITFTSQPVVTKKTKAQTTAKVYYIAKWGVHRFEYGSIDYTCKASSCVQTSEPMRLAFFERCDGLSKTGQPLCDGLVSSTDDDTNGSSASQGEARIECELNPWSCQRNNDVDGLDDPRDTSEDTLF